MGWQRGDTPIATAGLVNHLRDSALHHCRAAMNTVKSKDDFEVVNAAIHAGVAVELLTKMALALVNPLLLARLSDRDSGLGVLREIIRYHDIGLEQLKPGPMFTLGAQQALEVAAAIHQKADFDIASAIQVLGARNDAAHMGLGGRDQVNAAVESMVAYVEHCLTVTNQDPTLFWGETGSEAQALLTARKARLTKIVANKKKAAKKIWGKMAPSSASQEPIRASKRSAPPPSDLTDPTDPMRDVAPVLCHVCKGPGWLAADVYIEQEYDPSGEVSSFGMVIPVGFKCSVCQLSYDAEQLHFVGDGNFDRDKHPRGNKHASQNE